MGKRVARLNIDHYRKLLATESDETKRRTLQQLLAEVPKAKIKRALQIPNIDCQ